jgi:hypothetical protein
MGLIGVHGHLAEAELGHDPKVTADLRHQVSQRQRAPTAEVEFLDQVIGFPRDHQQNGPCDVVYGAEVTNLRGGCHGHCFSAIYGLENSGKEPISAIVKAGEGKGTQNGERALKLSRSRLQQRISRSLAGTIWMKGLDGIGFYKGTRLLAIYQAGADVDEVRAMIEAAVHLEKAHRRLHIELHKVKPRGLGQAESAGCAVDDDVGIGAFKYLSGVDGVTELVLDELHPPFEFVADTVHVPDRSDDGVIRHAGELCQDVVT